MIKIKEFSGKVGFSVRMLRYLEDINVLVPNREENNYRVYSENQIDIALKIKRLQVLGFQLKEVQTLKSSEVSVQIKTLQDVLNREQEIAEMKSELIPELKSILYGLQNGKYDLNAYLEGSNKKTTPLKTLGEGEKFNRTAYSIPILRNIYEDHLTIDANIELIATDLMKFSEWHLSCDYMPDIFSVLKESSFVFGKEINSSFIEGYEKAWKKFLPEMGFKTLDDFSKEDVKQLMGPHDIIIKSTFLYKDTGVKGEIIIPYSPVFTLSQLSNKT